MKCSWANSGEINQEKEVSVKDHLVHQQNTCHWHLRMTQWWLCSALVNAGCNIPSVFFWKDGDIVTKGESLFYFFTLVIYSLCCQPPLQLPQCINYSLDHTTIHHQITPWKCYWSMLPVLPVDILLVIDTYLTYTITCVTAEFGPETSLGAVHIKSIWKFHVNQLPFVALWAFSFFYLQFPLIIKAVNWLLSSSCNPYLGKAENGLNTSNFV